MYTPRIIVKVLKLKIWNKFVLLRVGAYCGQVTDMDEQIKENKLRMFGEHIERRNHDEIRRTKSAN